MTAPDPTPFLRPGVDLITVEDALVAVFALGCREDMYTRAEREAIQHACSVVRARLDRERRQACRRAALAVWREYMRGLDDCFARGGCRECERRRDDALAFRAAARAQ